MSEPVWMKYVKWPECPDCNGKGVRVDPKTQWPEECLRCKSGRESAIKNAQSYRRRAMKRGEVTD
jgi:hypothetical protein